MPLAPPVIRTRFDFRPRTLTSDLETLQEIRQIRLPLVQLVRFNSNPKYIIFPM